MDRVIVFTDYKDKKIGVPFSKIHLIEPRTSNSNENIKTLLQISLPKDGIKIISLPQDFDDVVHYINFGEWKKVK